MTGKRKAMDQGLDAFMGDDDAAPAARRPAARPALAAAEDEPLKPLTVYITDAQRGALEARAAAEDRSLGWMVRAALDAFLEPASGA